MILHFTCDDDLARIAAGLADTTLPKPAWTHAAHFAAALWLLRHGEPPLDVTLPPLIRRYNTATGVGNSDTSGYHETITLASLRATTDWLSRFAADHPIFDIANRLMASELGRPDWLLAYWNRERLFSPEARRQWVEPDIVPLPY